MSDTSPESSGSADLPKRSRRPSKKQGLIASGVAVALVIGGAVGVYAMGGSKTSSANEGSRAGPGSGVRGGPTGAFGGGGARGTVASVDGSTLTVKNDRGGQTSTVKVNTSNDTAILKSTPGSLSDLKVGDNVMVRSADSGADIVDASSITSYGSVAIAPANVGSPPPGSSNGQRRNGNGQPPAGGAPGGAFGGGVAGVVETVNGNTLTMKNVQGGTVTVAVGASTTYSILKTVKLSEIKVGDTLQATGPTAADGTVTATRIVDGLVAGGVRNGGNGNQGAGQTS